MSKKIVHISLIFSIYYQTRTLKESEIWQPANCGTIQTSKGCYNIIQQIKLKMKRELTLKNYKTIKIFHAVGKGKEWKIER